MNKLVLLAGILSAGLFANAQTVSDFENLSLATNSYWNGSLEPNGTSFSSGNAQFENNYSGYWSSGWAYSNLLDSTTAGYTNLYGAITGSDYSGTGNYAVGQNGTKIILTGAAAGKVVEGFYVTNSTYAALSMQFGDAFGKKFGGTTGTDADWFKLTIKNYYNGYVSQDSVDFYLANFTPKDSPNDYIVKDWRWVDLSSLGNTDSLVFTLSSSDNGDWGMNTPGFFCIDNFSTLDSPLASAEFSKTVLSVYPNPTRDLLNISTDASFISYQILDVNGKMIASANNASKQINTENLPHGFYVLKLNLDGEIFNTTFIKN